MHYRTTDSNPLNRPNQGELLNFINYSKQNNLKIKVATDDKKKTSKVFRKLNVEPSFVSDDPIEDFKYLSSSVNLFLSNSSYAFWAAMCSNNLNQDTNFFATKSWEYEDFIKMNYFE